MRNAIKEGADPNVRLPGLTEPAGRGLIWGANDTHVAGSQNIPMPGVASPRRRFVFPARTVDGQHEESALNAAIRHLDKAFDGKFDGRWLNGLVDLLISSGADPNRARSIGVDYQDDSALTWAAALRHDPTSVCRKLLEAGADPMAGSLDPAQCQDDDFVMEFKPGALSKAVIGAYPGLARLLIDFGANPNAVDIMGRPMICLAMEFSRFDTVRFLIQAGAKVTAAEHKTRITALHYLAKHAEAAADSHLDLFDMLRQQGADPNARDSQGKTPLHYAASNESMTAVREMLRIGADPAATCKDGGFADGYCRNTEIISLLRAARAKQRLEIVSRPAAGRLRP